MVKKDVWGMTEKHNFRNRDKTIFSDEQTPTLVNSLEGGGGWRVRRFKNKLGTRYHPAQEDQNLNVVGDVGPIQGGVLAVLTVEHPRHSVPPYLPLYEF
jgi:hypothetical protein